MDQDGDAHRGRGGADSHRRVETLDLLRNADDTLHLILEGVRDYAIYLLDPAGKVISWNAGAERMKGYTANEIIGQHFSLFYPENERLKGTPARALKQAADEGRFEETNWRIRKAGTRFWANVTLTPIRDPSGAKIGFLKITRDLTEQKRAADELNLLAAVVENSPNATIIIDREGRIVAANESASTLFGYPRDALRNQPIEMLLPDRHRAHHHVLREAYFREPRSRPMGSGRTLFGRHADGHEIEVDILIAPVRRDEQTLALAIVRDVTVERRLEAQLRQAQKMEAVGQLTGGIAHDFNNLLAVVIGSLDLLTSMTEENSDLRAVAEEALAAATRGAELNRQLLAFSRRQPLLAETVALNDVIGEMGSLLRRTVGETIALKSLLATELWPVDVDRGQFESALVNLLLNTRDAMPRGGQVTIETTNRHFDLPPSYDLPAGDFVVVSITDTGIGIPVDQIPHVFEPFFSTKETGKGSGLGLSMVYGFAKQSGGHVTIYSEVGIGTTVRLYLPRSKNQVGRKSNRSVDGQAPPLIDRLILVVDDNAALRKTVLAQLARLGCRTLAAEDGPSALAVLQQNPDVELLFTDIVMAGGMNGVELVEAAHRINPKLRVLFTSGFPEGALSNGSVGTIDPMFLLSKPYRRHELEARLLKILSQEPL